MIIILLAEEKGNILNFCLARHFGGELIIV